jgi:hypothetical protein
VDAPPQSVWPWIAQIGQGRGGLYVYQTLENLAGCQIINTTEILPEHQHPAVGDAIHPSAQGGSRLLLGYRYDHGPDWRSRLVFGRFPLEVISFVMSRKMLLEIKRLAECEI